MRKPDCHPEKVYGGHGMCRPCYNNDLRKRNPEYRENCVKSAIAARNKPAGRRALHSAMLKKRYGISIDERDRMFKEQNGLCKICGEAKKLLVEHCHKTKKVRGLTCNRCNQFVAQIENHPEIVKKALDYLGKE